MGVSNSYQLRVMTMQGEITTNSVSQQKEQRSLLVVFCFKFIMNSIKEMVFDADYLSYLSSQNVNVLTRIILKKKDETFKVLKVIDK